jgi:hypothetical protein
MSTALSPLRVLKRQADRIAATLKQIERGEVSDAKIEAARAKSFIKFGVAMDDKFISVEMPWDTIRENSEGSLSDDVLKRMLEKRGAA